MRYLSLFSGIEAASVAWHPLGWECVGVSEIEPFPCAVLAHHYPNVPNLGDVTKITEQDIAALGHIDLVVFGSPCQDLSVAGKRKGLVCDETGDITRSGLFFTAMRIIHWARQHCGCRFALWENVPGAFSSNGGRDFAAVVELMGGVAVDVPPKGWGTEGVALGAEGLVEWAVLDAQWFGVAQRRRRVFALADFGDWRGRPPLLLSSQLSVDEEECPEGMDDFLHTQDRVRDAYRKGSKQGTIELGSDWRYLTPLECERAQGFPDNYTDVDFLSLNREPSLTSYAVPTHDQARYKALGNSMAVPVMRWIGQGIDAVGLFQ